MLKPGISTTAACDSSREGLSASPRIPRPPPAPQQPFNILITDIHTRLSSSRPLDALVFQPLQQQRTQLVPTPLANRIGTPGPLCFPLQIRINQMIFRREASRRIRSRPSILPSICRLWLIRAVRFVPGKVSHERSFCSRVFLQHLRVSDARWRPAASLAQSAGEYEQYSA